ncbi:MAG: hypothetical protein JSU94_02300 [Phycisphaerales bacterium]|nr:MAG: hypothetical protein JSU94_02300 [Phycisphaerales bacterium]
MNTFWLKVAALAVAVTVLIVLAGVFWPSGRQASEDGREQGQAAAVGEADSQGETNAEPQESGPQAQYKPNPKVDYVARINELARAGRPENLNAAPFYQKAVELVVAGTGEQTKLARNGWPADYSSKERASLKGWVQSNSQALAELERAAQRPYYWCERSSEDGSAMGIRIDELAGFRQLSFALVGRARLAVAEGNVDQAVKDVLTCYRFGSHVGGAPMLIEQLVGIAITTLALNAAFDVIDRTEPGPGVLENVQRQIEKLSTDEPRVCDMRAERLGMLDAIQRVFSDDGEGDGRIHVESAKALGMSEQDIESCRKLGRHKTTEAVEKWFEYADSVAKKTPWQWKNEKTEVDEEFARMTEETLLSGQWSALTRLTEINARCRAHRDGLITTLAVLRYRADKGELPGKLEELVPAGYLSAVPDDPFSDGKLVYKRIGQDFTLYSFGEDYDDDGATRPIRGFVDKGGDQVFWPVKRANR